MCAALITEGKEEEKVQRRRYWTSSSLGSPWKKGGGKNAGSLAVMLVPDYLPTYTHTDAHHGIKAGSLAIGSNNKARRCCSGTATTRRWR